MTNDYLSHDQLPEATPEGLFSQAIEGNTSQSFHIDSGAPAFVMCGCTKNPSAKITTDFVPYTAEYSYRAAPLLMSILMWVPP